MATTPILIKVSSDVASAQRGLRSVGTDAEKMGKRTGRSMERVRKLARGAVAGIAALAAGVVAWGVSSVKSLGRIERINTQTAAAIKSTGGAAGVTATHVENLAGRLENLTATEAETTQENANLLLTFTKVQNKAGAGNRIFDRTVKTFVDMQRAIPSASMTQLGKALNDPVKGIAALTRVGVSFTAQQQAQIKKLAESGKSLKAQKIILGELNKEFGGSGKAFAKTAEGQIELAKHAFGTLGETIFSQVLPPLAKLAGKVAEKLNVAAKKFPAFKEKIQRALAPVGDVIAAAFGGLKVAASELGKIKRRVEAIDFGNLDAGQVGDLIGTAIAEGLNKLVSLSGKITESIGRLMAKVDWVGIGIEVGRQAPALLIGLAAGILDFDIGGLLKGLGAHWQTILIGIITLAFAPAKFAGVLGKVLARIPFVGKFLARAVIWLNELGGKMLKFGGDLFKSLWRGLTNGKALPGVGLIGRILGGLRALPGRVRGFFDDLGVRIGVWALDAFESIGRGARGAIGGTLRFLGSLPGRILSALGNLARLLFPKGTAVVESLVAGFRAKFPGVMSFLGSIPGRILSALGNVGSILRNAGASIIQGLIDGLVSKFAQVKSTLGGLTKNITRWKGPRELDKVLLKPAGVAIIKGLVDGFTAGTPAVKSALGKLTDRIRDHFDKLVKNDKAARLAARAAVAGLKDEYDALVRNARARDKLADQIKRAKDALRDLKGQALDYANTVRDAILTTGDLTALGAREDAEGNALPVTASNIIADLQAKVVAAKRFAELIQLLTRSGLNQASLQQIIDAGVEGGLGTAEALAAGGRAAIVQVNDLTAELTAVGQQLGASTSATMYDAGIQAAQGLVDGLAANAAVLEAQATKLAKALVKAVKKALGIKSPSTVFRDIASDSVRGMTLQFDRELTHVRARGVRLADAVTAGFGTPALDALASGSFTSAQSLDLTLTLSAEQLSALQRGRQIEADRKAFIRAGGRPA